MKKVFIQDASFAHCLYSNNPLPPIQFSDDIIWDRSGNYTSTDFVIYTDALLPFSRSNASRDIAWLIEPRELQPENYEFVERSFERFLKIFTHDASLLYLPNAVFIPYGGCWIKKEDFGLHPKSKNISIVCSSKAFLSGHKLRHQCIKRFSDQIDVFGNGYKSIDSKLEALADYRFQIVIENSKVDFWFTEKLIDCFVTGTVPIYYGSPSIGKFFDQQGMIVFNDIGDLEKILPLANKISYGSKHLSIQKNLGLAQKYLLAENSIFKELTAYGI